MHIMDRLTDGARHNARGVGAPHRAGGGLAAVRGLLPHGGNCPLQHVGRQPDASKLDHQEH